MGNPTPGHVIMVHFCYAVLPYLVQREYVLTAQIGFGSFIFAWCLLDYNRRLDRKILGLNQVWWFSLFVGQYLIFSGAEIIFLWHCLLIIIYVFLEGLLHFVYYVIH